MLSVNGLNAFIQRLLDIDVWRGIDLVICKILGKFTDEQRVQLLRIIVSMDSGTKTYFDRWFELEMKNSGDYEHFKKILQCISDYLGKKVIEQLLVCNNYCKLIRALLLRGKNFVDVMLIFTSDNKDITQQLINIVPQLIPKLTEKCNQQTQEIDRCWIPNIINFVCETVENCDLTKIVKLIFNSCIYDDSLKMKRSMWSVYLDNNRNDNPADHTSEKVDKFLKCVLEKLGQSAVEKLVVEHDDGQVITQVLTQYADDKLVNALLRHLSKERREEMERKLVLDAPKTITNLMDTNQDDCPFYLKNILHLQYVIKYADSVVLQKLVEIITQPYKSHPDSDGTITVWSSYLLYEEDDLRPENVDKFLLCVSNKLGKNKVKELVLHSSHSDDARQSVISSAASYGEKDLVEALLAHLTEEDRQEIQRDHVDTAVEPDAESLTSNYSTDEEIASSSDSIDDNSDEAISNRK
jgi:hypothetical protein